MSLRPERNDDRRGQLPWIYIPAKTKRSYQRHRGHQDWKLYLS